MELKIKVYSQPRIEFGAEGINGHKSTEQEREHVIEEFKRRNMDKFECAIADNIDLNTCQDLLRAAFDMWKIDYKTIELVHFTHKFEDLTLDFELVIKFEATEELKLYYERLLDYVHDWMYCEGAHIWLVSGWFGENNVECFHTIYADESNTDVSVEWNGIKQVI